MITFMYEISTTKITNAIEMLFKSFFSTVPPQPIENKNKKQKNTEQQMPNATCSFNVDGFAPTKIILSRTDFN